MNKRSKALIWLAVLIILMLSVVYIYISIVYSPGTVVKGTLDHDGIKRTYHLYLPDGYNSSEQLPLVFNLHGFKSNPIQQMLYGDFRKIADREGFLVVHPQGTKLRGNRHWNVGGYPPDSTVDDIGFIDTLLDELATNYNIDLTRVYVTGISNGGAMSLHLAINLSHRFAAVASVVGPMTWPMKQSEGQSKAMPVVLMNGTEDKVVPYDGDDIFMPLNETLEFWLERNGLDNNPSISLIEDRNNFDGVTAEHMVYGDGSDAAIELYRLIGGGHTWPGAPGMFGLLGRTCQDFDASEVIWEFFSRHRLDL